MENTNNDFSVAELLEELKADGNFDADYPFKDNVLDMFMYFVFD